MSDIERLIWEGVVTTDGDIVYVNGMLLASVLRASMPNNYGNCGRLTITVERSPTEPSHLGRSAT